MAAYILLITAPDRSIKTVEITQSTALIGREAGDVIVSDPRCSSRHAEITFDGRTVRFRDLGSTNGTFSQGKRIQELVWQRGMSVEIGKHRLTLQDIRETEGAGRTMLAGQTAYVGPKLSALTTSRIAAVRFVRKPWLVAGALVMVVGGLILAQQLGAEREEATQAATTAPSDHEREIRVVSVIYADTPTRVEGTSSIARVRVSPNRSGHVSVGVTEQLLHGAGDEWRTATWLAAFNAARANQTALGMYDINVYVRGRVDGPSAGMFMTVAMLALMNNEKLLAGTTMTGAINPDGTVAPVGCIVQKMEAARNDQLWRFGYPSGTRFHKDCRTNDVVQLDLRAKQLGLDAHEIVDLHDAYEFATGKPLQRQTPANVSEMALSERTKQLLEAKVKGWKVRMEREIAELNDPKYRAHGGDRGRFMLAKSFYDTAVADESNGYLSSALVEYAQSAIYLSIWKRFANPGELLAQKDVKSRKQELESTKDELEALGGQLEIKANTLTRSGQLNAAYSFAGYADAQAMMMMAEQSLTRAKDGVEKHEREELLRSFVFFQIAQEFLSLARDSQDLANDEGAGLPLDKNEVDRVAASFAAAASAALATYQGMVIAPIAAKTNKSLEKANEEWRTWEHMEYTLTANAIDLSSARQVDPPLAKRLLRLTSVSRAFLSAARLLNAEYHKTDYSDPSKADPRVVAERTKALNEQLKAAELSSRDAAGHARGQAGFIPTAARIAYQDATARREGNVVQKMDALRNYWESAFWSELAASKPSQTQTSR